MGHSNKTPQLHSAALPGDAGSGRRGRGAKAHRDGWRAVKGGAVWKVLGPTAAWGGCCLEGLPGARRDHGHMASGCFSAVRSPGRWGFVTWALALLHIIPRPFKGPWLPG